MTELLYFEDSYLKQFSAQVIDVDIDENAVVLNKTAFYAAGGGQPTDLGEIHFNNITSEVVKVKKVNGKIWHFLKGDLPEKGEEISADIDWDRRYKNMRTHTAMHAISAVVFRDYQAQVTGGNFEQLKGRLDFEFEKIDPQITADIEQKVNVEIQKGLEVTAEILPRSEAEQIPDLIRTKINLLPASLTQLRVVKIEGLDIQADGGTHVKNTSEIGTVKIVGYKSKGRINKRIKIEIQ